MKITSPAFQDDAIIPQKYTCQGQELSPPLKFSQIPTSTASLVLILDDPDAPSGTWVHWVVWNIDPATVEIAEGIVPVGSEQGLNSSGESQYQGPCPPSGEHRYYFKLFALDQKLSLPATATKARVEEAMKGHILESAQMIGKFSK